jgi:tRNA A-37 threonylcarbamoyl transferase component Bud32
VGGGAGVALSRDEEREHDVSTDNYARAKRIVQQATALPPAERAAYVVKAAEGDGELLREVESWLAASDDAKSFLDGTSARLCTSCQSTFLCAVHFCPNCGQPLEEDPRALIGVRLDNLYQIEELLGRGGMGAVYRARHLLLGDRVAIKTLRKEYCDNPAFVKRFQREGRAARAFRHPNAVTVYDLRTTPGGLIYMVLEYIEGHTLREEMRRHGSLSPSVAVEILEPIASVLDAAHAVGVVHRDLKPENVMVSHDAGGKRLLKVLDLGIAKMSEVAIGESQTNLTLAGQVMGTPQYMSPEQWGELQRDGQCEVDGRADVYSLGIIAFELLAGRMPFSGSSLQEWRRFHLAIPPPLLSQVRPGIDEAVSRAVARALAKDRQDRTPTAGALVEELRRGAGAVASRGATASAGGPQGTVHAAAGATVAGARTVNSVDETLPFAHAPSTPTDESLKASTAPPAAEPAHDGGAVRPEPGSRRTLVAVVASLAILASVAAAAFALFPRTGADAPPAASPPAPPAATAPAPAPVEAAGYYLEIEQEGGAPVRASGLEPVAIGTGLRFHVIAPARGYLALVAPDERNVPTLFLGSGEMGLLERGRDVAFPEREWLETTRDVYRHTLSVVFSPTPEGMPEFLRSGAPRRLTRAEQMQFDAFRNEHGVATSAHTASAAEEPVVRVPARASDGPFVFDINIVVR